MIAGSSFREVLNSSTASKLRFEFRYARPSSICASAFARAELDRRFEFVSGSCVIRLAQQHQRQVKMRGGIFRVQLACSCELLLRLFRISGLEVGHAQIVTELRIARPTRNRLLTKQDCIPQLARVQFLQQLLAGLGLGLILRLRWRAPARQTY